MYWMTYLSIFIPLFLSYFRVLTVSRGSRESRENLDRRVTLELLDLKDLLVPLDLQ